VFDYLNTVEELAMILRYFLDSDLIEHWVISNPHIEVKKDFVLDRQYQLEAKISIFYFLRNEFF
jgi:hypothetical protein